MNNAGDGEPGPATVLVVDDNQAVTRALSAVLKDAGYGCAIFHTALAAMDYGKGNHPAAAIIDIHLPDLSGLVLTSKLREYFGPGVPIIVLSGDTSMENINALPHVGATYFFSKPVDSTQLLDRLRDLIGPGVT